MGCTCSSDDGRAWGTSWKNKEIRDNIKMDLRLVGYDDNLNQWHPIRGPSMTVLTLRSDSRYMTAYI
jgi:hypothetical protein